MCASEETAEQSCGRCTPTKNQYCYRLQLVDKLFQVSLIQIIPVSYTGVRTNPPSLATQQSTRNSPSFNLHVALYPKGLGARLTYILLYTAKQIAFQTTHTGCMNNACRVSTIVHGIGYILAQGWRNEGGGAPTNLVNTKLWHFSSILNHYQSASGSKFNTHSITVVPAPCMIPL